MATGATTMDFEKPIAELERKIDELRQSAGDRAVNVDDEIVSLERKLSELRGEVYKNLTPIQRVQVALLLGDFALDTERVSGFHEVVELHRPSFLEQNRTVLESLGLAEQPAPCLHQRLNHQHAWHHRESGEMVSQILLCQ